MKVPADLGPKAEAISVTQRGLQRASVTAAKEAFNLGPYGIAEVNRKGMTRQEFVLGEWKSSNIAGGFTFDFVTDEGKNPGQCAVESDKASAAAAGGAPGVPPGTNRMACGCMGAQVEGWFTVDKWTASGAVGKFQTRGLTGELRSIHALDDGKSSTTPAGYELRTDKTVVAVEVLLPGRVWLSPSLDAKARGDLACLSAALMLYQPVIVDQ